MFIRPSAVFTYWYSGNIVEKKVQKSQAKQKEFYDHRSRSQKTFEIGDDVLLQQRKGKKRNGSQLQLLEFLANSIIL